MGVPKFAVQFLLPLLQQARKLQEQVLMIVIYSNVLRITLLSQCCAYLIFRLTPLPPNPCESSLEQSEQQGAGNGDAPLPRLVVEILLEFIRSLFYRIRNPLVPLTIFSSFIEPTLT